MGSRVALTKDEACFIERLIEGNEKRIRNMIYNTLGQENRYIADDAINDFYLLMCEKIDILKNHPCPEAWMLVAARHTAQSSMKEHKKDKLSVPLEEIIEKAGQTDVFEEALYGIWLENRVPEKLIGQLSKREKEVYCKIYSESKRPKEVATELNITLNAVNNIHKHLKDKIKNRIGDAIKLRFAGTD